MNVPAYSTADYFLQTGTVFFKCVFSARLVLLKSPRHEKE